MIKASCNKSLENEFRVLKGLNEKKFSLCPKVIKFENIGGVNFLTEDFIQGETLEKHFLHIQDYEKVKYDLRTVIDSIHSLNMADVCSLEDKHKYVKSFMREISKLSTFDTETCKKMSEIMSEDRVCFIHRDFKPRNIIMNDDNSIRSIVDWEFSGYGLLSEECGSICFSNHPTLEIMKEPMLISSLSNPRIMMIRGLLYEMQVGRNGKQYESFIRKMLCS